MDFLAVIGFVCLGTFIGLMVGWFLNSANEPTGKEYSAIIAAAAGAFASFVPFFLRQAGREIWFYPIALVVAMLLAPLLDAMYHWFYGWDWVIGVHKKVRKNYPK
jgi:hypothetical protein